MVVLGAVFVALVFNAEAAHSAERTADQLNPPVSVDRSVGNDAPCNYNRSSISPSGRYIVWWMTERGDDIALVQDLACRAGSAECFRLRLRSVSGARSLVWSTDNHLYLVPGDGPVRRISIEDASVDELPHAPFAALADDPVAGVIVRGRDDGGIADPVIPNADRTAVFLQPGTRRYTYRTADSHLIGVGTGDEIPRVFPVSAHWAEMALFTVDRMGNEYLAGPTGIARISGSALSDPLPALHQPRPIFDGSTGLLIGAHDDRQIAWFQGHAGSAGPDPELPADLDYIESLSHASESQTVALQAVHTDGTRTLVVYAGEAPLWQMRCPRFDWIADPPVAAEVRLEDWGAPGRPLPVRRRVLGEGSKATVVVWDGGPGSSFVGGHSGSVEQHWLRRGYDVAVIDGSGSPGLELGARLTRHQLQAVRDDAADAARHILQSDVRKRPVIVQGFSFGAIAAADMARTMALADPQRAPALLLVSPWLRYRSPADYATRVDFVRGGLSPGYAERSEVSRFGPVRTPSSEGYADQMDSWRAAFDYAGPTLILFGQRDTITRPEDVWPAFQAGGRNVIVTIAGSGHSVFTSAGGIAASDQWLDAVFANEPPRLHPPLTTIPHR